MSAAAIAEPGIAEALSIIEGEAQADELLRRIANGAAGPQELHARVQSVWADAHAAQGMLRRIQKALESFGGP